MEGWADWQNPLGPPGVNVVFDPMPMGGPGSGGGMVPYYVPGGRRIANRSGDGGRRRENGEDVEVINHGVTRGGYWTLVPSGSIGEIASIGPLYISPQKPSRDARVIESGVEAALNFLKYGCYDAGRPRDNPDVIPYNKDFARINNYEKYTEGWKKVSGPPSPLRHGGNLRLESPEIRYKVPVNLPYAGGPQNMEFRLVVKYYSAAGDMPDHIAITSPQGSLAHVMHYLAFSTGLGVNAAMAQTLLDHLPRCYDPY